MLKINQLHSWTEEETVKAFSSREYKGFDEWSSVHVEEWFGEEEIADMAIRLATFYVEEKYPEMLT